MYFSRILIAAFFVALLSSAVTSLYQEEFVTPIIIAAEVYEIPEAGSNNEAEPWAPEDGTERSLFTFSANFLTAFSFALLLIAAMLARGNIRLNKGILWGLAGYLCFFVAPALGLAPEIPGMEAAQLESRQAWWWLTVMLTAAGLWMVCFNTIRFKIMGTILMALPHIYGAPAAEEHGFAHPDAAAVKTLEGLWHEFIIQTSIVNGLSWLLIGIISAYAVNRFIETTQN
jgi:cobalt transporter subunit CbtA